MNYPKDKLGNLLALEYGSALPEQQRTGFGFPVFGSSGEIGRHSQALIKGPGIIVGRKGSVGEVRWSREDFWPIDTTYFVIPKEGVNVRWLYWLLGSLYLKKLDAGTGVPGLNRNDVYALSGYRARPEDQWRIAKVLDTVDESIAKTEAVIAKLKQVRAGLLHHLLTRGIDENGQIRDPAAHPEQFRDSPLGRLPRKWQLLRLEGASVKVQDGTHFSPKSTCGPRRYVTSKNIRFGFLDLTDCNRISEAEHREIYKRCDVQKHDILLTKDGANTGNAALNILDEEFSLLSSVALIRCRRGLSHYDFLLNYLISPLGQKRLKDMMSGNAITRLTLQKIKNFVIPLPLFDEQINIAEQLRACGDSIVSIENELIKLTKIKSGFMSDLLTGRVRVPEGII
jgi:type I restriction enzyme S subunit